MRSIVFWDAVLSCIFIHYSSTGEVLTQSNMCFFVCFSIKVYLYMQPDFGEAQEDKQAAINLVKRRKQLHSAGLSSTQNRYAVGDNTKAPEGI